MANEIVKIAKLTKEHKRIDSVMYAINEDTLKQQHIKQSKNKAVGIDGITKEEYEEHLDRNIDQLLDKMKRQKYKPQTVRRVYIPKDGSNKMRPLGIPSYEDKLVQGTMADILNVIYEPMFMDFSFGFRPNRSCHDAIAYLDMLLHRTKTNYVIDLDIKGFFEHVDHNWLMKFIDYRIKDTNFKRLIIRFLKAGIMEAGEKLSTEEGTPQGGIISPILANTYLHFVIDLWFKIKIQGEYKGECNIVRYADDVVACFQYEEEAIKFLEEVKERLKKFRLRIIRREDQVNRIW